jgi:hypothetical protein
MSIVLLGSTSGSITLQEPAVAGTTVLDLPATSGTVLTNRSIGTVLQVVNGTPLNSQVSTSSTSPVTTGLAASITPINSSNKILILVNGISDTSANNSMCGVTVYRGGTNLATAFGLTNLVNNYSTSSRIITNTNINFLDSPSTTSSTTYTVYFYNVSGSTAAAVCFGATGIQGSLATIILMEIAA